MAAENTTSSSRMPITRPAHQPRRRHHSRVDVLDALGLASRTRCVHPESDFVGKRRRRKERRALVGEQVGKIVHAASGKCRPLLAARADKNDRAQPRQTIENRDERSGERRCSNNRRGAAVAQDVGVLLRRQQRVERQHHDAGAYATPERDRKVHGVVEQQGKPLFRPQPQRPQRRGEPAGACLQFAVTQRPVCIDECDFFAEAARDLRIDKIGDRVIRPPLQQVFQHAAAPRCRLYAVAAGAQMLALGANAKRSLVMARLFRSCAP